MKQSVVDMQLRNLIGKYPKTKCAKSWTGVIPKNIEVSTSQQAFWLFRDVMLLRTWCALVLALTLAASFTAAVQQDDVKLLSACAANLSSPSPPVVAPLAAAFGAASVEAARTFIAATPLGGLLFTPDASTCLANLDGAHVRDALSAALDTSMCAPLRTVANLPAVRHLVGNMTAQTDIAGFAKLLRNVSSAEFDDFCTLYVDSVVPCLTTDLLPAIATIRATYASGCCDAWTQSAASDFGYSVSDLLLKYAQLFGDLVCARQTPSFQGNASQSCGYTFAQTMLTANDSATLGADMLVELQVPTDQMCRKADGNAYVDVNNVPVAATDARTASGCALALDRTATWVSTLPLSQRTNVFDVQSLFAAGKCLKGSELFSAVLQDFFPTDVQAVVGAYFGSACVHVPAKFADSCTFERSVALVDWASEPTTVKPPNVDGGSGDVKTDPTKSIVSFKTLVPVDSSGRSLGDGSGSSAAWRVAMAAAAVTTLVVMS